MSHKHMSQFQRLSTLTYGVTQNGVEDVLSNLRHKKSGEWGIY